jgi:hypothetical protein
MWMNILACACAVLPISDTAASTNDPQASPPAVQYRYSVVTQTGRVESLTITPKPVTGLGSVERPRPATQGQPGMHMLRSPWRGAGVYPAAPNGITEAPELVGAPGPWAVSIDFN